MLKLRCLAVAIDAAVLVPTTTARGTRQSAARIVSARHDVRYGTSHKCMIERTLAFVRAFLEGEKIVGASSAARIIEALAPAGHCVVVEGRRR